MHTNSQQSYSDSRHSSSASAGISHLGELNPAQLEAVKHSSGPLLVFAGAGSGKTRVLTRRIANLVIEHQIHPERIFAVTFTNKAAGEMRERVSKLIQCRPSALWVSTFHSSCARLLRRHAEFLDFSPRFAIYDSNDSLSTMKRVFKQLHIDTRTIDPKEVLSKIDRAKNNYQFPDDIRNDWKHARDLAEVAADAYQAYQDALKQSNAMDFGDLLCNVVTLFKLEPQVLARYQEQFEHILIDEYQDTNKVQYLLVQMLAEKTRNICVVGDDDQSIYAFRGATVENILSFRKDFPECKVVTLDINYRSTKNILLAANDVIAKNVKREKKTMKTSNPAGSLIVGFRGYDEDEEASFVAREISALVRSGTDPGEIGVFYRINSLSRAVEERLFESGIAYEIFGGFKFYERKEIKDILAYLRLAVNTDDNESLLRIINSPARGLGDTSIGSLINYASQHRLSLFRALEQSLAQHASFLTTANRRKFAAFFQLIIDLRDELVRTEQQLPNLQDWGSRDESCQIIAKLLQFIAERSEYIERLKSEGSEESLERIDNILELFVVARNFVQRCLDEGSAFNVSDFLDRASLTSDSDSENKKGGHVDRTMAKAERAKAESMPSGKLNPLFRRPVSLMTLHLAKGLEFDVVFIIGMEDGILPHSRSLFEHAALEEERRLCYVGITRAKKRLFLSRVIDRQTFGRQNAFGGAPSRFIFNLPGSVVDDRRTGFMDDSY